MHIVVADIQLSDISQDNMLPRGFPQGVSPLSNSASSGTKQSPEQLKILDQAKFMPQTTLAHISAEIEGRKVLDYEIIQEENV